jgi:molybdopterin-guanine dinucleotide biosynthesis protein A
MMGTVKKRIRCGGRPMTAVVLAGGRGRRMKADKARLDVAGRTLLEHVLAQVEPLFDEVLIGLSPDQAAPPLPAASRARIVRDEQTGQGPIGGLLAGLKAAAHDACTVIACDIPEIDVSLLRSLAASAVRSDIAVPVGPSGLHEPLFAVYRRTILPRVEELLARGERSLLPLYEMCRTAVVEFDDPKRIPNLNTRQDYDAFLGSLPKGPPARSAAERRKRARR